MRDEAISVKTERFTFSDDLINDLLNEKWANFFHDWLQSIHWFTEQEINESLSWPKGSPIQIQFLIDATTNKQSSLMTKRFTDPFHLLIHWRRNEQIFLVQLMKYIRLRNSTKIWLIQGSTRWTRITAERIHWVEMRCARFQIQVLP